MNGAGFMDDLEGDGLDWPDHDAYMPSYYACNGVQAIDVIDAYGLGFNLGNVVKYVLRAGKKGAVTEDLSKAMWYLSREIIAQQG